MINQSVEPANPGDILYFVRVMLFIMLLCMGYSLSRPTSANKIEHASLLTETTEPNLQDQEWAGLPSWQRKASNRAIEKYTRSQEKKWRRWNEAMFERSN